MKGVSVLVTGGAGFIGSHLTRKLVAEGAQVRILDNFSSGTRERLAGIERKVEVHEGDIRNAIACRKACSGVEVIFHMAAYISVPGSVQDPVTADAVNIGGTLNLLQGARDAGARRFVLSSSSAVYGNTEVLPTPETVLPRPSSPYGIEKLYGEHMVRLFHELHGMETVSLRYFNVFGPGQNPKSEYAAVIPKFITKLLAGETPMIFGDGEQTRDFLYVEDVVRANILAATADGVKGDVFNIAGGKAVSLNELAALLAAACGVDKAPEHGEERPGDIKHSSADIRQAKRRIGYKPCWKLADALEKTVAYYRTATVA